MTVMNAVSSTNTPRGVDTEVVVRVEALDPRGLLDNCSAALLHQAA